MAAGQTGPQQCLDRHRTFNSLSETQDLKLHNGARRFHCGCERTPITPSQTPFVLLIRFLRFLLLWRSCDRSLRLLSDSLITHGFGTPAVCAALSTFQTVLSEMLNYLDKNSSGKTSGPNDQQINNSSEKTQLRKTAESQSKDGKSEKTE